MQLKDKVILVTASTRGIGLATPVYGDLANKTSRR